MDLNDPLQGLTLTERRVNVGDVSLNTVEAGRGPLVILLHGFPEYWYSWRYQFRPLVDAGYRVVAPDMRGYNTSDKPRGLRAYDVTRLAQDVAGLVNALGEECATVIAHDWGAGVAWFFAMLHPKMLVKLVICNGPHPLAMWRELKTFSQLRRSWYFFFFQLPWLPELAIRWNNFFNLRRVLERAPRRVGTFSAPDVKKYLQALAQPGALTAAINYYRALRFLLPGRLFSLMRPVEVPVLTVWGEADAHLVAKTCQPGEEWVPDHELVLIPKASHWIQVDQPQAVNEAIVRFLAPSPVPAETG